MAVAKTMQEQGLSHLQGALNPGDTVYTVVKHVSSSGMSRTIQVLIPAKREDGLLYIRDISYNVALALDWKYDDKRGGVKVGGCGMDMGFHLVYSLSRRLYKDAHVPSDMRTDCGYWLNQSWL